MFRNVIFNLNAGHHAGAMAPIPSPSPAHREIFTRLSQAMLGVALLGVVVSASVPVRLAPSLGSDWLSHAVAFATLAVLSALAAPKTPLWRIWLGLTILGAMIEVFQGLPGVNRGPSVIEATWNALVVAITLLVTGVGSVRHRRQSGID